VIRWYSISGRPHTYSTEPSSTTYNHQEYIIEPSASADRPGGLVESWRACTVDQHVVELVVCDESFVVHIVDESGLDRTT
jgi:hypothetical protein